MGKSRNVLSGFQGLEKMGGFACMASSPVVFIVKEPIQLQLRMSQNNHILKSRLLGLFAFDGGHQSRARRDLEQVYLRKRAL